MANLLSEADQAAFLAATQDTTDTFMQQPVTFNLRTARLTAFNDSTRNDRIDEVVVMGLFILGQQEIAVEAGGAADLGDGYALFNRTDLAAAGLADAIGLLKPRPGVDTLTVAGIRYSIQTATPLGPLAGVYTLGKFIVKKLLQENS